VVQKQWLPRNREHNRGNTINWSDIKNQLIAGGNNCLTFEGKKNSEAQS